MIHSIAHEITKRKRGQIYFPPPLLPQHEHFEYPQSRHTSQPSSKNKSVPFFARTVTQHSVSEYTRTAHRPFFVLARVQINTLTPEKLKDRTMARVFRATVPCLKLQYPDVHVCKLQKTA